MHMTTHERKGKGVNQVALRAKTYTNRKGEKKMQVSGPVEEFELLVKGDKDVKADFDKGVKAAIAVRDEDEDDEE